MILSALVHLYEELCKQGKIQAEGWGIAKVTHRILLDKEGHLCGIISARKKVQRGKKEKEVPCEMCVPLPVTRSSGVKANFLCDNSSFFWPWMPRETSKEPFSASKRPKNCIIRF